MEELLLGVDEGSGALVLRRPVLIEAGQKYWVNDSDLVVEDAGGQRRRLPETVRPPAVSHDHLRGRRGAATQDYLRGQRGAFLH